MLSGRRDVNWRDLGQTKVSLELQLVQKLCDGFDQQGEKIALSPRPWIRSVTESLNRRGLSHENSLKDCNALLQEKIFR